MSNIICPSCKTPAPPGAVFCDNCGYDLRTVTATESQTVQPAVLDAGSGVINCPNCGHSNVAGSIFCENCGTKLAQPTPAKKPVAQPPQPAVPPNPPLVGLPDSMAETLVGKPALEKPAAQKLESIPGWLVISGQNVSIPIPAGSQTVIIGREDPVSGIFPDIDLDPHGGHDAGVGRRHAQIVLQNGEVMIEDLDSVNGTAVNKQKIRPRQPYPIKHGDEIRLGRLTLVYMVK